MPHLATLKGSILEHLIHDFGLEQLDPQGFYPQQVVCDIQKRMHDDLGLFGGELVATGRESLQAIPIPPEVTTLHDGLKLLHQVYQQIHRNVPEDEGWLFEDVSPTLLRATFNSPYEPFMAYGRLYFIANHLKPAGRAVLIQMEEIEGLAVYNIETI